MVAKKPLLWIETSSRWSEDIDWYHNWSAFSLSRLEFFFFKSTRIFFSTQISKFWLVFFFVREHIFCKSRLMFFIAFDVLYKFRLKYYVFTVGIILSATERHTCFWDWFWPILYFLCDTSTWHLDSCPPEDTWYGVILWVFGVLGVRALSQSARIFLIRVFSYCCAILTSPNKGETAVCGYNPALFLVLSVSCWCLGELIFSQYDQHCSILLAEFNMSTLLFLLIRSL